MHTQRTAFKDNAQEECLISLRSKPVDIGIKRNILPARVAQCLSVQPQQCDREVTSEHGLRAQAEPGDGRRREPCSQGMEDSTLTSSSGNHYC